MGKPLAITEKQATTLLRAAEKQNAVIEVQTPMGLVRLIPSSVVRESEKRQDDVVGHF
ncbi:hypothetical protein [Devosia sp. MC521]|uniref:hypothetical protein n=1 Tax=Devosia sp. MC521 TaxID=2759954 RepID=UPI0015FB6FA9|nr:hypothetical protein [Devosia sp. MC521]MBJ6986896.1 hypothetical protein [Devosia sp. MC521]QMW63922.1 hypothetical protein H4N61_06290 [Devosia sp. MC521]